MPILEAGHRVGGWSCFADHLALHTTPMKLRSRSLPGSRVARSDASSAPCHIAPTVARGRDCQSHHDPGNAERVPAQCDLSTGQPSCLACALFEVLLSVEVRS